MNVMKESKCDPRCSPAKGIEFLRRILGYERVAREAYERGFEDAQESVRDWYEPEPPERGDQ